MKASELRSKNADELQALLLEMRRKQFNLRMEAGTGQPARSSDVRETRKTIARIKTLMNERRGGENA